MAAQFTKEDVIPLSHAADYARGEIIALVQRDQVCHLDDLLLRRTLLAIRGKLTPQLLEEVAQISGASLGWDAPRIDWEIARSQKILHERHAVSL